MYHIFAYIAAAFHDRPRTGQPQMAFMRWFLFFHCFQTMVCTFSSHRVGGKNDPFHIRQSIVAWTLFFTVFGKWSTPQNNQKMLYCRSHLYFSTTMEDEEWCAQAMVTMYDSWRSSVEISHHLWYLLGNLPKVLRCRYCAIMSVTCDPQSRWRFFVT